VDSAQGPETQDVLQAIGEDRFLAEIWIEPFDEQDDFRALVHSQNAAATLVRKPQEELAGLFNRLRERGHCLRQSLEHTKLAAGPIDAGKLQAGRAHAHRQRDQARTEKLAACRPLASDYQDMGASRVLQTEPDRVVAGIGAQ
jgi:hypothetical protein